MKNRVEQLRKEMGLSQEEFARALRVSRQTVSSIENGKYNPSLELAFQIADFFQKTIEELFLWKENDRSWSICCWESRRRRQRWSRTSMKCWPRRWRLSPGSVWRRDCGGCRGALPPGIFREMRRWRLTWTAIFPGLRRNWQTGRRTAAFSGLFKGERYGEYV